MFIYDVDIDGEVVAETALEIKLPTPAPLAILLIKGTAEDTSVEFRRFHRLIFSSPVESVARFSGDDDVIEQVPFVAVASVP